MAVFFFLIFLAAATSALPHTKTIDCPSGWVNAHEDGCFKFLGDEINATWFEAMVACEQVGGYLVEPKNQRQMEFLTGLVELETEFYGPRRWWLGLSDTGHEGTWVWTHSYQEVSETFWGSGSPSNQVGNNLDCAIALLEDPGKLAWYDISCEEKNSTTAPICQRDIEDSMTTTAFPTSTTTTSGRTTTTGRPWTTYTPTHRPTYPTSYPTITPWGLQCYQCNSYQGGCSDTSTGELFRCGPRDKGCFISRAMYGSDVAFERGCTEVSDESLYKCQTVEDNHGNNVLHYCNCHGTGCNRDWASAGEQATSAQPGDTTTRNF